MPEGSRRFVSGASALAGQLSNMDMRDQSLELDGLVGRAAEAKRKSEDLTVEFGKIAIADNAFSECANQIKEGLKTLLAEAAQYCGSFLQGRRYGPGGVAGENHAAKGKNRSRKF